MATISIEFGKESSQKTREVYLLVRQGKTTNPHTLILGVGIGFLCLFA